MKTKKVEQAVIYDAEKQRTINLNKITTLDEVLTIIKGLDIQITIEEDHDLFPKLKHLV